MSGFANTVFTLMIGWFQTVVSLIWSGLTDKNGGNVFTWIGNHWIVIVLVLCAVGTIIDLSVYIARWKPIDVIRSYFERKKEKNISGHGTPVPDSDIGFPEPAEPDNGPPSFRNGYTPLFASNHSVQNVLNDSFSENGPDHSVSSQITEPDWQEQPEYRNEADRYKIPDDSPYRRPISDSVPPVQTYRSEQESAERSHDPAVRPRRRRINVSELFGNPEE